MQIANVGFQDMDHQAVSKAVASDTLFIHGSLTGGGGSMFHAPGEVPALSPALRLAGESNRPAERCTASCGAPSSSPAQAQALAPAPTSVCDRSCYAGGENGARFGGHLCGAGDVAEFGAHCRTCFDNLQEAQAAEERLAEEERFALARRGNRNKSAVEGSWKDGSKGGPTSKRKRALRADGVDWAVRREGGGAEGGGEGEVDREGDRSEEASGLGGTGRRQEERGVGGDGGEDDCDEEEVVELRRHVIMCDTLMPPPPAAVADCSLKCQRKADTVSGASKRASMRELHALMYLLVCVHISK